MSIWTRVKNWWLLEKPDALPMRAFGAEDDDYTWEDWKEEAREDHPVRYFFQETLPHYVVVHAIMPVEELLYWIRAHTKDRYHVLSLKSPQNHYTWGWIDADRAMLHACFNLLKDFVEKEMPGQCYYIPAEENGGHEWDERELEKEIKALYQWWMVDRQKHMDADPLYYHKEGENEDDVMMARLMKIRRNLWS